MRNLLEQKNTVYNSKTSSVISTQRFLNIEYENEKKELFLNLKLERAEKGQKEIEIHLDRSECHHLFDSLNMKKINNDFRKIDYLFIKLDYVDAKSVNLIMDDIDDLLNELLLYIHRIKLILLKENL